MIRGMSFDIAPRTRVGIVGRTGAGKSSLTTALFRLVEPSPGSEVKIDGLDVLSMGLEDLRSKLAIVPQVYLMYLGVWLAACGGLRVRWHIRSRVCSFKAQPPSYHPHAAAFVRRCEAGSHLLPWIRALQPGPLLGIQRRCHGEKEADPCSCFELVTALSAPRQPTARLASVSCVL